jgi:hypothetical protein
LAKLGNFRLEVPLNGEYERMRVERDVAPLVMKDAILELLQETRARRRLDLVTACAAVASLAVAVLTLLAVLVLHG